MKVLLFTNKTLITPHLADLFARIQPLKRIEIMVYVMQHESYEAVNARPGHLCGLLARNESAAGTTRSVHCQMRAAAAEQSGYGRLCEVSSCDESAL